MRPDIEMLSEGLKMTLFKIFLFLSIIFQKFWNFFLMMGSINKRGGWSPSIFSKTYSRIFSNCSYEYDELSIHISQKGDIGQVH